MVVPYFLLVFPVAIACRVGAAFLGFRLAFLVFQLCLCYALGILDFLLFLGVHPSFARACGRRPSSRSLCGGLCGMLLAPRLQPGSYTGSGWSFGAISPLGAACLRR